MKNPALIFGAVVLVLLGSFALKVLTTEKSVASAEVASPPDVATNHQKHPKNETSGLITFSVNPIMTDKVKTNSASDRVSVETNQ